MKREKNSIGKAMQTKSKKEITQERYDSEKEIMMDKDEPRKQAY